MSREAGIWLLIGWQAVASVTLVSWVLSDITKPGLRTEARSWRQFTADYGFYLLVSLHWPLAALLMLAMFVWELLASPARRSP